MAEQLDNSIQSLVAEQVDVQIHRLYQDTRDNWKEVCPTLSHQFLFLTLALKNLDKRKADLKKKKQSRSVGAINSVNAEYSSVGNKPSLIDLSISTKVVELITKLVSFRQSQPISGGTTRPERHTRALTKIALSCAREVLTFLIGEILRLREILPIVPRKEGSLFLDFKTKT